MKPREGKRDIRNISSRNLTRVLTWFLYSNVQVVDEIEQRYLGNQTIF